MKFQNFDGTEEKGRRSDHGDGVQEVLASESSKRDARGGQDRNTIQAALDEIDTHRLARKTRLKQIETRLAQIKRQIMGNRLHHDEYHRLCEEQNDLIHEVHEIETQNAHENVTRLRLLRDLNEARNSGRLASARAVELLVAILRELKEMNKRLGQLTLSSQERTERAGGGPRQAE
jgi:hypothetical protein